MYRALSRVFWTETKSEDVGESTSTEMEPPIQPRRGMGRATKSRGGRRDLLDLEREEEDGEEAYRDGRVL